MEYDLYETLLVFPQLNTSIIYTAEVPSDVDANGGGIFIAIGL